MAMHLLARPRDFDVVVTENLFGDILTDEASMLPGSLGLLPSASLGTPGPGLYEPIHGSAPDIAGKGIANPVGQIWCGALMLDFLGHRDAHDAVLRAIEAALQPGSGAPRTPDLGGKAGTSDLGRAIASLI